MKWVTLCTCLFLISFTESKHSSRGYQDVEPLITISGFIQLPENILKFGTTALLSQFVQNATFEDIEKLAKDIVALARVCDADRQSDPRCEQFVGDICTSVLCHESGLAEKYGFTKCCTVVHQERYTCFLNRKDIFPDYIRPLTYNSINEYCKECQDHNDVFKTKAAYDFARRYPITSLYMIVKVVSDLSDLVTVCCQTSDKLKCIRRKASFLFAKFEDAKVDQSRFCAIEETYEPDLMYHCKFAMLNKKFPKASLSTLSFLAWKLQSMYHELCQGNTLLDFTTKADILHDICTLRFNISTKLDSCCERHIVEQPRCLEALEDDDTPADLSLIVKEFIEDIVLQCRTENNATNWAKHLILYEYSRGRTELPVEPITQLYEGYMGALQKCCQTVWRGMCGTEAEYQLETQTAKILNSKNDTCIFYDSRKNFSFQDMLLHKFTKRLPQLSFVELYKHTKKFAEGIDDCCHSNDSQKVICIEEKVKLHALHRMRVQLNMDTLLQGADSRILHCRNPHSAKMAPMVDAVLGDICRRHKAHPINSQLGRCCSGPRCCWLTCFHSLGEDKKYDPVPFSPEFHEDLCSANPDNQHIQKQRFLVNLIKSKPTITVDQLRTVMIALNALLEKCCQVENHKRCFRKKVQKLISML